MSPVGGVRGAVRSVPLDSIPDSVEHHWPIDEGSGQTLNDAVGDSDFSLNFENWIDDSAWWEGWAVKTDGTDDRGDATISYPGGAVTLLVTVEFPSTPGNADRCLVIDTGFDAGHRSIRTTEDDSDVLFQAFFVDDSDDGQLFEHSTVIQTDTKYRVAMRLDPENDEVALSVNNNIETDTNSNDFSTGGDDVGLAALNGGEGEVEAFIDNPQIAFDALSDSEIEDDYNNQPWS